MEWTTCIKRAIEFMESDLLAIQGPEEVAEHAYISPMYLQKGFQIMTGFSLGEYMRSRKLYLAAMDFINTDQKVIEIAFKYGYETPESFTKAFTRFHDATPSDIRKKILAPKVFLPLKVSIVIQGGNDMDYTVEQKKGFKVIGFVRSFNDETSYAEIPKFWDEVKAKYCQNIFAGKEPAGDIEKAIVENEIGEYGICLDDTGHSGNFRYIIGGTYKGGPVPEGMEVVEVPEHLVAHFNCTGPMPGALQAVNTKIWKEWLPGNSEYELDGNFTIEWYSKGNMGDAGYKTYIEIPVRRK